MKVLIALIAKKDWFLYQLDVKSAFLNEELKVLGTLNYFVPWPRIT